MRGSVSSSDSTEAQSRVPTLHVFYTMAGGRGHAADALARSPQRESNALASKTLRDLGMLEGRPEQPQEPVWPSVSVFAAHGPRRDVFDPTTSTSLASIRSAQWAHIDASLTRMQEAQRRWAKLTGKGVRGPSL
jgi:hypothetical protein